MSNIPVYLLKYSGGNEFHEFYSKEDAMEENKKRKYDEAESSLG